MIARPRKAKKTGRSISASPVTELNFMAASLEKSVPYTAPWHLYCYTAHKGVPPLSGEVAYALPVEVAAVEATHAENAADHHAAPDDRRTSSDNHRHNRHDIPPVREVAYTPTEKTSVKKLLTKQKMLVSSRYTPSPTRGVVKKRYCTNLPSIAQERNSVQSGHQCYIYRQYRSTRSSCSGSLMPRASRMSRTASATTRSPCSLAIRTTSVR